MDPLTMGLIGGGASLLGSIFSSDTSAKNTQAQIQGQEIMQAQSEQFNAAEAEKNREFQGQQVSQAQAYNTQMSNTAYQRASADMQAAGLNPMMMFGSGGPASVPSSPSASGSTASVGTPSVPMPQRTSPLAGLGDAVQKVFSTAGEVQKLTQQQADIDLTRAQKHQVDTHNENEQVDIMQKGMRNPQITDQVGITAAQRKQEELKGNTAENITKGMNPAVKKAVDIGAYTADKVGDVVAPIINSAGAVRRFLPTRSQTQTSHDGSDTFTDRWSGVGGSWQ